MTHRVFIKAVAAGACVLTLGLTACAPRVDTRGNLPNPDQLASVAPGEHSKLEVMEILGSPSSIGSFGDDVWYYVSQRTETEAFFEPEVTERKVVIIRFNKKGVLEKVETKGLDAGQKIEPVERETPTVGNKMTILQQLFGNLGRFSK